MFAIVSGSFVDGQEFIGPFFLENDANQYAEKHYSETNWEIVPLVDPGNAVRDYIDNNDRLIRQVKDATDDAIEQYGGSLPVKVLDLLLKLQTNVLQDLQKNLEEKTRGSSDSSESFEPSEQFNKIRIVERFKEHLEEDCNPVPGVKYYEIDACDDNMNYSDQSWTVYDGKLIDRDTAIRIVPEFCKEIGRPDLADKFQFGYRLIGTRL